MFASRSQLCVHSAIKNMSGAVQKAACDNAVRTSSCTYWHVAKGVNERKIEHLADIADIEDLHHVGTAKHVRAHASPHLRAAHIDRSKYIGQYPWAAAAKAQASISSYLGFTATAPGF